VLVRQARRDDLIAIRRVAESAYWEGHAGLLKPDTIGRLLGSDYSPSALSRRLLRGGILVMAGSDAFGGFLDATPSDDALEVATIATDPGMRASGIGRSLVAGAAARHPDLPIAVDVYLGNLAAEGFLEHLGFVPGEIVQSTLFEEDVVQRRWWHEPGGWSGLRR
jgi:GNAT superfamily N-acetyltransferase